MQPKVSVIMPSLNVGPYIRECIESVVNQALKEIEIICVDAGSTDGTLDVLEEYAAKDNRITIIHSNKRSYGHQMNLGIEAAGGEYIGIVETDDYIAPNMYEELYAIANENQVEVLRADCVEFEMSSGEKRCTYIELACSPHLYNNTINPTENSLIFKKNHLSVTGIYLTSFLKQNIQYHETNGASYQDIGFKLQCIAYANKYMFYDKAYYYYRKDNPNSSIYNKDKVYIAAEEHDWARQKLIGHPNEKAFAPGYAYCRFKSYEFTMRRIAPEFRKGFLKRFSQDFKKIKAKGELDPTLYSKKEWIKLHVILRFPLLYLGYINTI